jgi:hypothetical protein
LPPAPPRRRRRTGLLAAVALAAAAVTVALVLAGGDDDPPTADGDRPDRTTATASAAAPRVPVPNATGRGELAEFTHFRTRIPPNWEVEGPIDVVRPQERLGDALVTTFRPKADAAPDRVTVAYFGAGEFTATSRVDRREANLQRGDAYRAGEVAETITVGPHTMIRWMFDTLDRGEWLRWERFAFDVGGVGFDVVAGGRPGAVADVARRMAEALDLLKACPTPVSGGSAPIEATDLVAINATCKEAQAVLAEAYFTCGAGRLCAEAGDGYTCAVENNRLRCRASGRREVTARLSA